MRVHLDETQVENGTPKIEQVEKVSKKKVIKRRRLALQTVCTSNTPEKIVTKGKQKRKRELVPAEAVTPKSTKEKSKGVTKENDVDGKIYKAIKLEKAVDAVEEPKAKKFKACMGTHLQKRSPKCEKEVDYVYDTRYGTCDIQ